MDLRSGVPNKEFMLIVLNLYRRTFRYLRRLKWDANLILTSYSSRLLLVNLPLPSQPQNELSLFTTLSEAKLVAPTWLAS